jgi:hypothetical protein
MKVYIQYPSAQVDASFKLAKEIYKKSKPTKRMKIMMWVPVIGMVYTALLSDRCYKYFCNEFRFAGEYFLYQILMGAATMISIPFIFSYICGRFG